MRGRGKEDRNRRASDQFPASAKPPPPTTPTAKAKPPTPSPQPPPPLRLGRVNTQKGLPVPSFPLSLLSVPLPPGPRAASHLAPPTPLPTPQTPTPIRASPSPPDSSAEHRGRCYLLPHQRCPWLGGCRCAGSREEVFGTLNNPLLPLFPPPQPVSVPKWRRPDPQCSGPSLARWWKVARRGRN